MFNQEYLCAGGGHETYGEVPQVGVIGSKAHDEVIDQNVAGNCDGDDCGGVISDGSFGANRLGGGTRDRGECKGGRGISRAVPGPSDFERVAGLGRNITGWTDDLKGWVKHL